MAKLKFICVLVAVGSVCISGCSTEELPQEHTGRPQLASTSLRVAAADYGFSVSANATLEQAALFDAVRDDAAAFLRYRDTGAVVGWSLPHAPAMHVGWPADAATHEQLARAYFAQQGIPQSEVGAVYNFRGSMESAPIANPSAVSHADIGFSTVLHRRVAGADVPDSHAGVQLNAAGSPVSLSIAWPDVPVSVIADAQRLAAIQGWTLPAATARLYPKATGSRVVIRHSLHSSNTMSWRAVFRTDIAGARKGHVDTDEFGNVVHDFDAPSTNVNTK